MKQEDALAKLLSATLLGLVLVSGGYDEWTSAATSIVLVGGLWVRSRKQGGLTVNWSIAFASLWLLPLFAVASLVYGVDRGETLVGIVKFLPLPLFALALLQVKAEDRGNLFSRLPEMAAILTLVAMIGRLTPARDYFFQAGRLGGFFQSPNAWAAFLLVAIVFLCHRPGDREGTKLRSIGKLPLGKWEIGEWLVCMTGIVLTGSRSAFFLLAFYMLYVLVAKQKLRKLVILLCLVTLAEVACALLVTGNVQSFGRFLTIGVQNSTLWGRLLYIEDALPMLRDFPMGMGYMGYYFAQGTYQTGDYAVMYVHNEFLQCALDFGIPCAILIAIGLGASLFSRRNPDKQKTILLVLLAHSMVDFDLQFLALDFLLVWCMDLDTAILLRRKELHPQKGKPTATPGLVPRSKKPIRMTDGSVRGKPKRTLCRALKTAGILALLLSQTYALAFSGLYAAGKCEAASLVYPGLTVAQAEWIQISEDISARKETADRISERNPYCVAAWKVKAENAAIEGDYEIMVRYARKAIRRDRYNEAAYEDYLADLSLALDHYVRIGDEEKVLEFVGYAASTATLIQQAEDAASPLAFKTRDDPTIELSEEYNRYLKQMQELQEEMKHDNR